MPQTWRHTIQRKTTHRIVGTAIPMVAVLTVVLLVAPKLTSSSAQPGDNGSSQPSSSVTAERAPALQPPQYRIGTSGSLQVSRDAGSTWSDCTPLPSSSRLLSYGADSAAPLRIAATTADNLYLSEDAGSTWREIPIKDQINRNVKLTAVDLSPFNRSAMLVGTSFDGFYETTDLGRSWKQLSDTPSLHFFYRGAGFWEEVTSITYDRSNPNIIDFGLGYGYGSYRYDRSTQTATRLDSDKPNGVLVSLPTRQSGPGLTGEAPLGGSAGSAAAEERLKRASNRVGFYLSPYSAREENLPAFLAFAKKEGLNSIVVDFKDDFGYLRYKSSVKAAIEDGAVHPLFDAKYLISQAHAQGIYVIARMVVFKDRELYNYDNHKYALWDSKTGKPWGVFRQEQVPVETKDSGSTDATQTTQAGDQTAEKETETRTVQVEWWADPYSEFVWDYNIAIAKELQDLGVDEIQFDYIRFPSDGNVSEIVSHYKPEGMDRVAALSAFLKKARNALTVPISVDVYGFNAWYRTVYLGQDIEALSHYVDVICPMFYPSHFSREFYQKMTYLDRAQFIYNEGSRRAEDIVGGRAIIRPYVQAFLLGGELKFDTPTYWKYLTNQLTGLEEGHASGFILWNASNRYYMVVNPLTPFTRKYSDAAVPPVVSSRQ